jgi:hypothetical protein
MVYAIIEELCHKIVIDFKTSKIYVYEIIIKTKKIQETRISSLQSLIALSLNRIVNTRRQY